ncbi:MAG: RNA methyltransferase [Chloroflexi bacterium]|nr:RNA methyltransferase [Chloroflexota bacterium]
MRITSPHNERVRYVRSLWHRDERRRKRRFVLEGPRFILDALRAGTRPELILADDERLAASPLGRDVLAAIAPYPVVWADARALAAASETTTPQGIVAVFAYEPQPPVLDPGALLLLLDGIQDPGNVGTIVRTAEAAGVRTVALLPGCADVYGPKALRAGAGAQLWLTLLPEATWEGVAPLLADRPLWAADVEGQHAYDAVDWRRPAALLLGSEAHGPSAAARERATGTVRIPLAGRSAALNVAAAAAVLLFEALRQRRSSGTWG